MALPLQKTTDSLFKCLGKVGVYKGRKVLFLLSEPDEVLGIGFSKAQVPTLILKVRISDAPEIGVGDEIEDAGRTYRVIAEPRKDPHRLIWTLDVGLMNSA